MNIVRLIYFKQSGKYYTEGEYMTECEYTFQISDEVRHLRLIGHLPGLIPGGGMEFKILVEPLFNDNPPSLI